jgi:hypothetical protein
MWIPDWCQKVHQLISQIGYFHFDAGSVPNWVFLRLLYVPNFGKLNRCFILTIQIGYDNAIYTCIYINFLLAVAYAS